MLQEFHNIFGTELKAVTGDTERIDDLLEQVADLIRPLRVVSKVVESICLLRKFCKKVLIDQNQKKIINRNCKRF